MTDFMNDKVYSCYTSKGIFGVILANAKINGIFFPGFWDISKEQPNKNNNPNIIKTLEDDLNNYFDGKYIDWQNRYELSLNNGTMFQKKVWGELTKIPYGNTVSYFDLAKRLNSKAYRAVGNACGRNPIPILIPCHRVLAKNGGLGGFTSGIEWKKFLLSVENVSIR